MRKARSSYHVFILAEFPSDSNLFLHLLLDLWQDLFWNHLCQVTLFDFTCHIRLGGFSDDALKRYKASRVAQQCGYHRNWSDVPRVVMKASHQCGDQCQPHARDLNPHVFFLLSGLARTCFVLFFWNWKMEERIVPLFVFVCLGLDCNKVYR